ncbi:MAG: recombinase family protein [Thermoleophilaceae bacterium]|nr:recombinase family protein [Thermoleophilaceae bacterium]
MSEPPIRAASYTRVSSKRQAEEGLSLPEQQRRTKKHIVEVMEWEHVGSYIEPAVSGKVPFEERPGFKQVLRDLDGIDRLVIPKLDRLGRSASEMLAMMDRLEAAGVYVVNVVENIDTSTPMGRFLRTVLSGVAELERDRIAERVSDANETRAREGRRGGAPPPYGYDTEKGGALVVLEAEAVIVRRVFAEWCAGVSQREVAARLNREGVPSKAGGKWHQSSISQILSSVVYRGDMTHRGEAHPGEHEAIVSRELWAEAEQLREARKRSPGGARGRRTSGSHLFAGGLLRCGFCGEPMVAVTQPTRTPGVLYEVYSCSGRRRRLPFQPVGGWPWGEDFPEKLRPDRCPQTPIKRHVIDEPAWAFFEQVGLDLDATRSAITQVHDARREEFRALREQAEREARKAEDRLARVRRDYQDGRLDADDWNDQRDQLTAELEAAHAEAARHAERERDLEAEGQALDAESTILNELAEMRALVAGQVRERSGQSLDAVRAALTRLFERFELVTHPLVDPEGQLLYHPTLNLPDDGGPRQWLRPYVRPEAIEHEWSAEAGSPLGFPALRKASVTLIDSTSRSSTRSCSRACARCSGARRGAGRRACSAWASWSWTRSRARSRSAARRSSCRPRSSPSCDSSPRTPRASTGSTSCCATSGATARSGTRGRSTPMPAGCGRSCAGRRGAGS